MKTLYRRSDGGAVAVRSFSTPLQGGEGEIMQVDGDAASVAKVYHVRVSVPIRKLEVMVGDPPESGGGHRSLAWPTELLVESPGAAKIVGFVMPKAAGVHPVFKYYVSKVRAQICPEFSYRYLASTARNLAGAVRSIHAKGYVLGDVNESNILVDNQSRVTIVDADSFQVHDGQSGDTFRCPVGKPEFTPPELQGKSFADVNRVPEHDLFGLAVVVFKLLMEGTHPFDGVFQGAGDPPELGARIKAGHFAYGTRKTPFVSKPAAPAFEMLSPSIRALMLRAFEEGHVNPAARPTASEWSRALQSFVEGLKTCPRNELHQYSPHLADRCPWCERAAAFRFDAFPVPASAATQVPLPPAGARSASPPLSPQPFSPPAPVAPPPKAASAGVPSNWIWAATVAGLAGYAIPLLRLPFAAVGLLLASILYFAGSGARRAFGVVGGLASACALAVSLFSRLPFHPAPPAAIGPAAVAPAKVSPPTAKKPVAIRSTPPVRHVAPTHSTPKHSAPNPGIKPSAPAESQAPELLHQKPPQATKPHPKLPSPTRQPLHEGGRLAAGGRREASPATSRPGLRGDTRLGGGASSDDGGDGADGGGGLRSGSRLGGG